MGKAVKRKSLPRLQPQSLPSSNSNYPLLPTELRLALDDVLDLSTASVFCLKQAQCAALYKEAIEEVQPGKFVLKSPFKESFVGSLHIYPNSQLSPADTIGQALRRHVEWYLGVERIDIIRSRFAGKPPQPQLLTPPLHYWEGLIDDTGRFSFDPALGGTPAIVVWKDMARSFAIEVTRLGSADEGPTFKRNLITSAATAVTIKLNLSNARAGRPHKAGPAEMAAYLRDHEHKSNSTIAKKLCSNEHAKHTRQCFDRLNKLADSFYKTSALGIRRLLSERAERISK